MEVKAGTVSELSQWETSYLLAPSTQTAGTVSELYVSESATSLCIRGITPPEGFLFRKFCIHKSKDCMMCSSSKEKFMSYVSSEVKCIFPKRQPLSPKFNNFIQSEIAFLKDFLHVGVGPLCKHPSIVSYFPLLKGLNIWVAYYIITRLKELSDLEANLAHLAIENTLINSPHSKCQYTIKHRDKITVVNKKTFLSVKAPAFETKKGWVKLAPQGISSLFDVVSGLRKVISILDVIGGKNPSASLSKLDKAYDIFKLVLDSLCCYNSGGSLLSIMRLLLSAYDVVNGCVIKAQSLDAFALSAISMLLPKPFLEIIKRMSLFTTAKIMDDPSCFSAIFTCCVEFLIELVQNIPKVGDIVVPILRSLPFSRSHVLLKTMQTIISDVKKDKTAILSNVFREKVDRTQKIIEKDASLIEWSRRSTFVKNTMDDFKGVYKMVLSYCTIRRVEPICVAFEGPPGVFKSVLMNQLLDVFRQDPAEPKTIYSHSIRSVMDGKDFYDTYNNEDVFVMDDLGQQGISQFRNIINWVSEVKYPLECAEAKLKNTKFFNSELIMFTTNQFQTLTNFSKDDCINNPTALFRRTKVFDFSGVRRSCDMLSGIIEVRVFNEGKGYYDTLDTIDASKGKLYILKKMRETIKVWLGQNKHFNMHNDLTPTELATIYAQGLPYLSGVNSIDPDNMEEDWSVYLDPPDNSWIENAMQLITSMFPFDSFEMFFNKETLISVIIGIVLFTSIGFLRDKFHKKARMEIDPQVLSLQEVMSIMAKQPTVKCSSVVSTIQKHIKPIEMYTDEITRYGLGLVSGHCIIIPAHYFSDPKITVTVYSDASMNQMMWDKTEVNLVYHNKEEDIVIYMSSKYIASPFKNISHLFSLDGVASMLVSPSNIVDINPIKLPSRDYSYSYVNERTKITNIVKVDKENSISYQLGGEGMCGTLICDSVKGIRGMHVAGSGTSLGVACIWSTKTIETITNILQQDVDFILDIEVKPREAGDVVISGCVIENSISTNVVTKTNLIPSPLYGHIPNYKYPPHFKAFGSDTIKVIGRKSMAPVKYIDSRDLKFAEDWLRSSIEPFGDITMTEVIKGNASLSGLNKKSSNGIGFVGGKDNYINFETGELTALGKKEFDRITDDISSGTCVVKDNIWMECLKDEPRLLEKVDKPRSFRCCNVVMQLLTKQVFGNFVSQIQRDTWHNGVMIGMNPLKDFDKLFNKINSCKIKWGGDFKTFDGGMLTQLQETLARVVMDFYTGPQTVVANYIITNMPHCLVLMKDELVLTSHSMPSGSFLTALVNSLINRMLTACWYSYMMRSSGKSFSVASFVKHVVDCVYGDDKLTGVTEHDEILNMMTMAHYFDFLGLGFTNSKKSPCTTPGEDWTDITFLKREFMFSHEFTRIICPLDPVTMYSSLNWIDKNKDMQVVLNDKLGAFQREAYLHGKKKYKEMLEDLTESCKRAGVHCEILPESYLKSLVASFDAQYLDYSYLYV